MGVAKFIVGRIIGRFIGLNVRYLFFKIIGRDIKYQDLKPIVRDEYNDKQEALQQDLYNAIVGAVVLVLLGLIGNYIII